MNITADNITVGEKATINVNIPRDAIGNVTITVDGTQYNATIKEGVASVNVSNLFAGKHDIIATYDGGDIYTSNYATGVVNVSRTSSTIEVSVPTDVKAGEKAIINVTLLSDASGSVTVKVGDKTYDAVVKNGKATIVPDELTADKYMVNATYNGDNKYNSINSEKQDLIVSKNTDYNIAVIVPTNVEVGENATIIVTVPTDATGNVTITVDNKQYNVTVNSGVASVNVIGLGSGEHKVTAALVNAIKYDSKVSEEYKFNVSKTTDYSMNITVSTGVEVGGKSTITVNVPNDADGNVMITVASTQYNVTVNNGVASVDVTDLSAGENKVSAKLVNDNKHANKTTSESIFYVNKVSDYDMNITVNNIAVGEKATISVNVPKNALSNVTISVDGKDYNATIKNGVASVIVYGLGAGKHDIIATYDGGDIYTSNYATGVVNVSKTSNYKINITVPTCIDANEKAIINVTLPNDATGIVTVKVGDKTYDAVVNNDGTTIITSELTAGIYEVNATYNGDNKYNPTNSDKKEKK